MWGEGEVVSNHVSCAFCRNWEISKGAREGSARPRSPTDAKLKTYPKNPLERGLGEGTVEVCVEGTAVAGDLATTVGIGAITCWG